MKEQIHPAYQEEDSEIKNEKELRLGLEDSDWRKIERDIKRII